MCRGRGERHFQKKIQIFVVFLLLPTIYYNYSENTNTRLTSEKRCRIGIEISATPKEEAAIQKEKSQKCFK